MLGIMHLVRTQNFPKKYHFLPTDTHTYVCEWGIKKCEFFGKFCVSTKWMIPSYLAICLSWLADFL